MVDAPVHRSEVDCEDIESWLILLFRSFGSFLVFDLIEVRDRAGADDLHDDGRPAR